MFVRKKGKASDAAGLDYGKEHILAKTLGI